MSTLITQTYKLNLIPGQHIVVVNCAAYDNSPRLIRFDMYNGDNPVDISGWSARVEGTRQGTGEGFSTTCSVSGTSRVSFALTNAMTATSGKHPAVIVFYDGTTRVASATFILNVSPAALDEGIPATEEDNTIYQQWLTANTGLVQENANNIATLSARMDAFASLPEGSTTGDAELIDIRVAANGTTYPTAGDAVRGQVNDINGLIDNATIVENLTDSFKFRGYIALNGGIGSTVSTTPVSSNVFNNIIVPCNKGDKFTITGTGGNASRLWGVTDTNFKLLRVENADFARTNLEVPITADGYFIANVNTGAAFSLYYTHIFSTRSADIIDDNINNIYGILGDITVTSDLTGSYNNNGYINLSGVTGSTVSTTPVANNSVNYIIVKVSRGDKLIITGKGGTNSRLYGITDDDLKLIYADGPNTTRTDYEINIKQDGYFISNVLKSDPYSCIYTRYLNSDDISGFDNEITTLKNKTTLELLALESGGLRFINGAEADNSARVRTQNKILNPLPIVCPSGIVIHSVFYYLISNDYFISYESVNANAATITPPGGCYAKITFAKTDGTSDIYPTELADIGTVSQINDRLSGIEQGVANGFMASYKYDHDIFDCASIVQEKDYTGGPLALEKIYSYFDELVSVHSDYVTRTDIAADLGLTYPQYANGISGSSVYLDTPAYKTYMYKFVSSNPHVNTNLQKKGKILIIGATHGSENAAPFNMYVLGKRLCEDYLGDPNIFSLKCAYDIYMIPCLNGYGMYHQTRTNANGVDINRNYPIRAWAEAGEGTDHYTGPSAGSEFESQIVIHAIADLDPDLLVDHHNYYNLPWQFYTEINNPDQLKESYLAATDCSFAFKKNLPAYFGTDFDFVIQRTGGSAPGQLPDATWGNTCRYGYEIGVPFSTTIEISNQINFSDGEPATPGLDVWGADSLSVAEYTLRNQLLHYTEWLMRNKYNLRRS